MSMPMYSKSTVMKQLFEMKKEGLITEEDTRIAWFLIVWINRTHVNAKINNRINN